MCVRSCEKSHGKELLRAIRSRGKDVCVARNHLYWDITIYCVPWAGVAFSCSPYCAAMVVGVMPSNKIR